MNHDYEELERQLLSQIDDIIKIITKGNTAEVKKSKDGVSIFEVAKKKIKKDLTS